MDRADQSRTNMAKAMDFVTKNINPSDIIFTDYQSDLILGHYLCRQRPISFDVAPANFEQFHCEGYRIASTDYKTAWMFWADNFPKDMAAARRKPTISSPGTRSGLFRWDGESYLPEDLRKALRRVPRSAFRLVRQ